MCQVHLMAQEWIHSCAGLSRFREHGGVWGVRARNASGTLYGITPIPWLESVALSDFQGNPRAIPVSGPLLERRLQVTHEVEGTTCDMENYNARGFPR